MSDQFHYLYRAVSGDFVLTARLAALTGADLPAQAGLMVRNGLAATSDLSAIVMTPAGAQSFSRAHAWPSFSRHSSSPAVVGRRQCWLKLVRHDARVQGYITTDSGGAAGPWQKLGDEAPIGTGMVYLGFCAASGRPSAGPEAVFDQITFSTAPQPTIADGTYRLSPFTGSSMVMDAIAGGNAPVTLATATATASQKWRLTFTSSGFYKITSVSAPNLALTADHEEARIGSKVLLKKDADLNTQLWAIVPDITGTTLFYHIQPKNAPGNGLSDHDGDQPGAAIALWLDNDGTPDVQWTIVACTP
jgi:hypothetical protein